MSLRTRKKKGPQTRFTSLFAARLIDSLTLAGVPASRFASLGLPERTRKGLEVNDGQLEQLCLVADGVLEPHYGVTLARTSARGAYGLVEFLCRSARTLREAAEKIVRFQRLEKEPIGYSFTEASGFVTLEHPGFAEAAGFNEYVLALMLFVARQAGVEIRPERLWFQHRPPREPEALLRLLGAKRVLFDQHDNGFVFDAKLLDLALGSADPALHEVLVDQADEALASHPAATDLVGRVKEELRARLHRGPVSLRQVAGTLALGERTLQRRLDERGTSFQQVLDEVRRSLAQVYVLNPDYGLEKVASLLGYSEVRALSRSFRRWTGMSPRDFRESKKKAR